MRNLPNLDDSQTARWVVAEGVAPRSLLHRLLVASSLVSQKHLEAYLQLLSNLIEEQTMSTPVIETPVIYAPPADELQDMLFPYEDTADPTVHTHIVNPPMNKHIDPKQKMTAQEIVSVARITSTEIVALCGYRWVPKYNPDKFDVCEKCMKVAADLMAGAGE
jgi:hypothetical protein